jgi:hypothetical protein
MRSGRRSRRTGMRNERSASEPRRRRSRSCWRRSRPRSRRWGLGALSGVATIFRSFLAGSPARIPCMRV